MTTKPVPIEPTEEMVDAGRDAILGAAMRIGHEIDEDDAELFARTAFRYMVMKVEES